MYLHFNIKKNRLEPEQVLVREWSTQDECLVELKDEDQVQRYALGYKIMRQQEKNRYFSLSLFSLYSFSVYEPKFLLPRLLANLPPRHLLIKILPKNIKITKKKKKVYEISILMPILARIHLCRSINGSG